MSDQRWAQQWCGFPAVVDGGHNVRCARPEGHGGDCAAVLRDVKEHRRGGSAACRRSGCDRPPPSATEQPLGASDDG